MGVSRAQGYKLIKRAWRQIHDDIEGPDLDRQEMLAWCVQTLLEIRPKRNETQELWWRPSASSIGCAVWVLINVGTASTDAPTELLHSLYAEFASSPVRSAGGFRSGGNARPAFLWAVSRNGNYALRAVIFHAAFVISRTKTLLMG